MRFLAPIRLVTLASLTVSTSLWSQLPAQPQTTPPSTLPATPATAAEPSVPLTPSQQPPKRAQITYADGTLSISAENSSLNQILRQISADTGMKITGGVADERVFGHYGPAAPAEILASLLDGTGSNMILVHREPDTPAELILTPRQGSVTPPNPNASASDDRTEPEQVQPPQATGPQPESRQLTPAPPTAVTGPPATGASPSSSSSQPDSPNGVKTPQQIYEQLQRLRQQQQQQQQQTQPQ